MTALSVEGRGVSTASTVVRLSTLRCTLLRRVALAWPGRIRAREALASVRDACGRRCCAGTRWVSMWRGCRRQRHRRRLSGADPTGTQGPASSRIRPRHRFWRTSPVLPASGRDGPLQLHRGRTAPNGLVTPVWQAQGPALTQFIPISEGSGAAGLRQRSRELPSPTTAMPAARVRNTPFSLPKLGIRLSSSWG